MQPCGEPPIRSEPLERGFFARSAPEVARDLLGCLLMRTLDGGTRLSGIIAETEAYTGPEDGASHAFAGRRTPRNASMWAREGTCYVYFTYGMHHCVNVSCLREGHPAAVLIRALFPEDGLDTMRTLRTRGPRKHPLRDRNLCDGPGKLCQALAIDRDLDGVDLLQSPHLVIRRGPDLDERAIECTPRIGIGDAHGWADKPLRWVLWTDPRRPACEKMQRGAPLSR